MLPKYIVLGSKSVEEDVRESVQLTSTMCTGQQAAEEWHREDAGQPA